MSGKKLSVLISGCSTGIGEATAKLLAEKGWIVFAGVRKQEDADKLQGYSDNIRPVILDVTKEDQIREVIEQVRVAVGEDGLDGLVNNAGLMYTGPNEFISMEDVGRQFDVNVFGCIRLTQAAMPLLRKGMPGRIVNISSIAPEFPVPYTSMYAASKAAMETISYTTRLELAKWNIKVVVIRPGPVETNFGLTASRIAENNMKSFTPGTPCYEQYGKDLENFGKAAELVYSRKIPPTFSAKMIHKALTVRKPKHHYYDTWSAWTSMTILGMLPSWLFDKVIGCLFLTKQ